MKKSVLAFVFCLLLLPVGGAMAQFTGPSASGQPATVAQARDVRLGSYVTLTGHIVNHQREDYFTFRDDTGEIRVEIDRRTWGGRQVGPDDKVRVMGEVERGLRGRYIDVKSLEVL